MSYTITREMMIMTKIVVNYRYGGFGVSRKAFLRLRELGSTHALEDADYGEYWKDGSGPRDSYMDSFEI